MERQRLIEWEKQRKAELVQHRQREQEKVLELKAKQEHLNSKLESMVRFRSESCFSLVSRFIFNYWNCFSKFQFLFIFHFFLYKLNLRKMTQYQS